jgi:anti-anti-sigma factor
VVRGGGLLRSDPVARDAGLAEAIWTVTTLAGEIDIATPSEVFAGLVPGEDTNVLVDLLEVTFFGAAGIGHLVIARNHLRAAGRDLLVSAASPVVMRILTACRMMAHIDPRASLP